MAGEGFAVYLLHICSKSHRPYGLQIPGDAPLPCMYRLYFTANMFFHHAGTSVGWTDLRALFALEKFYRMTDISFRIDRAFCHKALLSPHGSGVAFDFGRDLSTKQRRILRYRAVASGLFAVVLPESVCPDCVHVEVLRRGDLLAGDCGVHVFSLQHALQKMHLFSDVCSGIFCRETERAVQRLQYIEHLPVTGIADARFFELLYKRTAISVSKEG